MRPIKKEKAALRQWELLKKYYEVDEENKKITIAFHYEKASDILNKEIGNEEHPQFKKEILDQLNDLIPSLPIGYKIDIVVNIQDYEGYSPNQLLETFNDALELNQYYYQKQKKKTWLRATSMIVVGILLTLFYVFGLQKEWFGSAIQSDIVTAVIDSVSCVFIWEAVTMLFIDRPEGAILGIRIRRRVSVIRLFDGVTGKLLIQETAEDALKSWADLKPITKFGEWALLISSAAFIGTAFANLFTIYNISSSTATNPLVKTLLITLTLIEILVLLCAGIGGYCRYLGIHNKFSSFVSYYVVLLTLVLIGLIIASIFVDNFSIFVHGIFSLVINIFFIVGYLIQRISF